MNKKRLLIFHPTIAPYRVDFFNHLFEGFDTQICLYYRNLKSQKFDYAKIESQFVFTPQYLTEWLKFMKHPVYGGIWKKLKSFKPDIVIVNEYSYCTIAVLLYKWLFHKSYKIISICDDNQNMVIEHNDFSMKHRVARKMITPLLDEIILPDSVVTLWYQIHYDKGFYFPIIRDEEKARAIYEQVLPKSRELVEKYNLKDKYVFLHVGRLVKRKNIDSIIKAFSLMDHKDCVLVIIGDGAEMPMLKLMAGQGNVILTGRLDDDELYAWYNVGDCFVLASYQEPFGAVTNEALLAGCWCLVSEKAGSQCLIQEDYNGYTFNPYSIEELKEKMEQSYLRNHAQNQKEAVKNNLMLEQFPKLMDCLIEHFYQL